MEDFRRRFQRDPEGMWLPETAVDSETLDIMAERGIRFVILAPRQAASVREGGDAVWTDATGERVDTGQPYFCSLRSGRTIAVFFYHGALAQKVAFGDALNNGGLREDPDGRSRGRGLLTSSRWPPTGGPSASP